MRIRIDEVIIIHFLDICKIKWNFQIKSIKRFQNLHILLTYLNWNLTLIYFLLFQDAIKEAKKSSPQSGILVKSSSPIVIPTTPKPIPSYASPNAIPTYSTTTPYPTSYYSPSYSTTTPRPEYNYQSPQSVDIRPHGNAVESAYLPSSRFSGVSSSTESPLYSTPYSSSESSNNQVIPSSTPIAVYSSTEAPFNYDKTPLSITQRPSYNTNVVPLNNNYPSVTPTTYRPPIAVIEEKNYPNVAPIESSSAKSIIPPNYSNNFIDNVKPLYQRPSSRYDAPQSYQYYQPNTASTQSNRKYASSYNQVDSSESSIDPAGYDGVSVTNNGFRYFLPRQYHEEENSGSSNRAGSFGYIDPFGIRRVVYYNTSPEGGFVHRKNNRYVGFNATPYDPRPSTPN